MTFPADFQFSQASLQDYVECARRFQLRYLERVLWPAPQALPLLEHEARLARGQAFHRLAQQQLLGIPEAKLMPADSDLARWWEAYLATRPADITGRRYVEITLAAPLAGLRLLAKYDCIVIAAQSATIFDWKTSARPAQPDGVSALFERLQTRVYRYLLALAGADLNDGRPLAPAQVTMVYWFAESPADPVAFPYNAAQFAADERVLTGLITEIRARDVNVQWELTPQERRCRFCGYRSLCARGAAAGTLSADAEVEDIASPDAFALDFEQIAEIAF